MTGFLPASLCLTCLQLLAQVSGDSLLSNERSIDRPLTLHKGQMRAESGYGFSTITRRFDESGTSIKLSDEGLSFARHTFFADLRIGLLENLQIQMACMRLGETQRKQQIIFTDANGGVTQISEVYNKKGFDDFLFALTGRLPYTSKKLDILGTAGVCLPTGDDKQKKPSHSSTEDGSGFRDVVYRYNSAWGRGTVSIVAGGNIKYRTKYFAFTASGSHTYPLGESKGVRWLSQYSGGEFQYEQQSYSYQTPTRTIVSVEVERQLSPWFDLSVILGETIFKGGWTEANGALIKDPDMKVFSVNPGYEILITPKVWLRQRMTFSLAGESSEAVFSINTSLVYNFFPLR